MPFGIGFADTQTDQGSYTIQYNSFQECLAFGKDVSFWAADFSPLGDGSNLGICGTSAGTPPNPPTSRAIAGQTNGIFSLALTEWTPQPPIPIYLLVKPATLVI